MISSSTLTRYSCSSQLASGVVNDEHLDLVELVHPEHAAHVLAVGARLAPEARRVARVPQRQIGLLDDLPHVEGSERHLGGAHEVELVLVVV